MGNMGIYFKDDKKKERWDSGQAILHRESRETQNPQRSAEQKSSSEQGKSKEERETRTYGVKNSFGRLDYLKKGKDSGHEKEGLALEAFEAPGTPVHTEKEKHLDPSSMKKIDGRDKKRLYASEVPFHDQAFFYEMPGAKKSDAFLKCMKMLVHRQGHQTLQDALGFLDQTDERLELKWLKENRNELFPDESDRTNKEMDTLNSRLLRKEAKERQLCNELQVMLDARTKEGFDNGKGRYAQTDAEKKQDKIENRKDDGFLRRIPHLNGASQEMPETDEPTDISEDKDPSAGKQN